MLAIPNTAPIAPPAMAVITVPTTTSASEAVRSKVPAVANRIRSILNVIRNPIVAAALAPLPKELMLAHLRKI